MAMMEGAGVELHFEAHGQGPPVLLGHPRLLAVVEDQVEEVLAQELREDPLQEGRLHPGAVVVALVVEPDALRIDER